MKEINEANKIVKHIWEWNTEKKSKHLQLTLRECHNLGFYLYDKLKQLRFIEGYNACIGDFGLEPGNNKYISELETLIDSALPIVEIFKAESPAQKKWKKRWVEKARKVTG